MPKSNSPDRSIWTTESGEIQIVDQRYLPHELVIATLASSHEAVQAISEMWVRGAPLIGATAAYGYYLGIAEATDENWHSHITDVAKALLASRPTAVNLAWAVKRMRAKVTAADRSEALQMAWQEAAAIAEEDIKLCHGIGMHGLELIKGLGKEKVNVLTHCNAGRMATVKWGTATAPIYLAHQAGIDIHVWVDETRPRNQGARITAWELAEAGIPHTVIVDNAGGHLMQAGQVDICLVGTDRTARNGDVANKIGTYLKALAAHDNEVPFYVALPSSTIDWECASGSEIPIEERSAEEVTHIWGHDEQSGSRRQVQLTPTASSAVNFGFDITPAKYVTGLITERGVCDASEESLRKLFIKNYE